MHRFEILIVGAKQKYENQSTSRLWVSSRIKQSSQIRGRWSFIIQNKEGAIELMVGTRNIIPSQ